MGSDNNEHPDLGEVLASIRRITAAESGHQWSEPFQLPAVFRPDRTQPAQPEPSRLVNKLSELLRQTPVTPELPAPSYTPPTENWTPPLRSAFADDDFAMASQQPQPSLAPPPETALPPRAATPRYRVLQAEQSRHILSEHQIGHLVGDLVALTANRMGYSSMAAAGADSVVRRSPDAKASAEGLAMETLVSDLLRPMLQEWLVENMRATIEHALAGELGRIFGPGHWPPTPTATSRTQPPHERFPPADFAAR